MIVYTYSVRVLFASPSSFDDGDVHFLRPVMPFDGAPEWTNLHDVLFTFGVYVTTCVRCCAKRAWMLCLNVTGTRCVCLFMRSCVCTLHTTLVTIFASYQCSFTWMHTIDEVAFSSFIPTTITHRHIALRCEIICMYLLYTLYVPHYTAQTLGACKVAASKSMRVKPISGLCEMKSWKLMFAEHWTDASHA